MKKILISLAIVWILLGGRKYSQSKKLQEVWSNAEQSSGSIKTSFLIETLSLWSGSSQTILTKNGKIQGKSEIIVTALVAGRVEKITKKIGDVVSPNELVVGLKDTNGSISYGLQKTQVSVDSARNSYQQQEENLKKQLNDARIAYERSQLAAETAKKDFEKQWEKSQYDLTNTNPSDVSSTTKIQLDKLQKDLEKAQFDYETKIKADEQQSDNFVISAKNIHSDTILLLRDIFDASDSILWISPKYQLLNDPYESNLWALDTQTFRNAVTAATRVQDLLTSFQATSSESFTIENLWTNLIAYKNATQQVYVLVTAMKDMFAKTVVWNNLTEIQLTARRGQFDGYQAKAQGSISSITAQVNAIASFLSSYKLWQESIAKSIDSFKSQIALTEKQLSDAQFNTQLGADRTAIAGESSSKNADLNIASAKTTVDYLTNTRDSTLDSIYNQLLAAQVAYNEIANNADKFQSKSPLQGVIADVLVDPGQDVSPGTPLYKVVSDSQEIEITVTTQELELVAIGSSVRVKGDQGEVSAHVVSRSAVADKNANFKIIIWLDSDILKVGTFADVMIATSQGGMGVPVNAVRIVDNGVGEIFLWNGNDVEKKTVQLGQLLGTQIEVKTSLPSWSLLILTNMERYDPKVHEVKLKWKMQK